MKMAFIAFAVIVVLLSIMLFGSVGLAKLALWFGLPPDALAILGMIFIFLTGISLAAWRIAEMPRP